MKNLIKTIVEFFKKMFGKKKQEIKLEPKKMTFKEWKAFRKANPLPRFQKPCKLCGKPMFVSVGQIVYFHGECRTKGRNRNAYA